MIIWSKTWTWRKNSIPSKPYGYSYGYPQENPDWHEFIVNCSKTLPKNTYINIIMSEFLVYKYIYINIFPHPPFSQSAFGLKIQPPPPWPSAMGSAASLKSAAAAASDAEIGGGCIIGWFWSKDLPPPQKGCFFPSSNSYCSHSKVFGLILRSWIFFCFCFCVSKVDFCQHRELQPLMRVLMFLVCMKSWMFFLDWFRRLLWSFPEMLEKPVQWCLFVFLLIVRSHMYLQ